MTAFFLSCCFFAGMALLAWYRPPVMTGEKSVTVPDDRYASGHCWVLCSGEDTLYGLLCLSGTGKTVTVTAYPAGTEVQTGKGVTCAALFADKGAEAVMMALAPGDGWFCVSDTGAEAILRYLSFGVVLDGRTVTAVQVRQRWQKEYARLTAAVLGQYMTKERDFEQDYRKLTELVPTGADVAAFTAARPLLAGWTDKPYLVREAPGDWVEKDGHPCFVRKGDTE